MDFAGVFDLLTAGKAVRSRSWGGYLKDESYSAGHYFTFVKRNGDMYIFKRTTVTLVLEYVGKVAAGEGGALAYPTAEEAVEAEAPVATSLLDFDPVLFGAMSGREWEFGNASEFERGRHGTGIW